MGHVIAVLHQSVLAPAVDGVAKPPKPGGYRDSSADIAFALATNVSVIATPDADPDPRADSGWSFDDDHAGIAAALDAGADTIWANTVLHRHHALGDEYGRRFRVVAQPLLAVARFDDKFVTNAMLRAAGLPVARSWLVADVNASGVAELALPMVVKPVRGRGSTGVTVARTIDQLRTALDERLAIDARGMLEEFLPGREITIAVLPPGRYAIDRSTHWALPVIERVDHHDDVAPYNGVVPVAHNSHVIAEQGTGLEEITAACTRAAELLGTTAVIRIDARQGTDGRFALFDVNLKPNLTGAGRPGRDDQDSLVTLAAHGLGWSYTELLGHLLENAVPQERIVGSWG